MHSTLFRHRVGYFFLAFFALAIGLYPLRFIGLPYEQSLLADKAADLLASPIFITAFYLHISLGGLALLMGFTQFFPRLRRRLPKLHRNLGKVYVLSVLISGSCGLLIAIFASGGIISTLGFAGLAGSWLFTTLRAYTAIRRTDILRHQQWMIRSYALCFAAVTLRLYLPLAVQVLGLDFLPSYRLIAWLCWVPNLLAAELVILPGIRPGGSSRKAAK